MPNLPIPRFQIALDQIDFLPIDAQLELLHIYTSYNRKRNHTREQRISQQFQIQNLTALKPLHQEKFIILNISVNR